MDICIDADNFDAEIEEVTDLICSGGVDTEIGHLKINPERVPLIMSEEKAERAICLFDKHSMTKEIQGGKYLIITDDRSVNFTPKEIHLYGNAFIVKKQKLKYTGLTLRELEEIVMMMNSWPTEKGASYIVVPLEQGGWYQ